jgi:hypothetical protein
MRQGLQRRPIDGARAVDCPGNDPQAGRRATDRQEHSTAEIKSHFGQRVAASARANRAKGPTRVPAWQQMDSAGLSRLRRPLAGSRKGVGTTAACTHDHQIAQIESLAAGKTRRISGRPTYFAGLVQLGRRPASTRRDNGEIAECTLQSREIQNRMPAVRVQQFFLRGLGGPARVARSRGEEDARLRCLTHNRARIASNEKAKIAKTSPCERLNSAPRRWVVQRMLRKWVAEHRAKRTT